VPTGLFIVKIQNEEAHIKLDYVITNYRDFQVARFIFEENAAFFFQHGIRRFVSEGGSDIYRRHLKRMGFVKSGQIYAHEVGRKNLKDNRF